MKQDNLRRLTVEESRALQRAIRASCVVVSCGAEPLGEEFERVWDENVDDLYEP